MQARRISAGVNECWFMARNGKQDHSKPKSSKARATWTGLMNVGGGKYMGPNNQGGCFASDVTGGYMVCLPPALATLGYPETCAGPIQALFDPG